MLFALVAAAAFFSSGSSSIALAREALAAGSPGAAESLLRAAVRSDPHCGEAQGALGVALASLGVEHSQEADAAFAASIALQPHVARHHINRGIARQAAGAVLEALQCFGAALEVEPTCCSALIHTGDALAELGELEGAAAALHRAVELAPDSGEAWNRLGKLLHEQCEYDQAAEALSTACRASPGDATARHNLGIAMRAVGRFDEARAAFEAAAGLGGERDQSLAYFGVPPRHTPDAEAPLGISATGAAGAEAATPPTTGVEVGRVPLDMLPPLPDRWVTKLRAVHVTNVATAAECDWLIRVCEEHAAASGRWDAAGHHDAHPTRDLVVASVPAALAWLNTKLHEGILATLAEQFGLSASDLWLTDGFLVKYSTACQPGLGLHVDDSELSFTILLSPADAFVGGGTHFEALGETVSAQQGQMISHCGMLRHAGVEVTAGTRYILAGFVRARPLAAEGRCVQRYLREEREARRAREEEAGTGRGWSGSPAPSGSSVEVE
jgi:tetratricopeptide (TPR) repeat protein